MQIVDRDFLIHKTPVEFSIVPIGDIHFNSMTFDEELWDSFLNRIKEIPNPLFILLGDITDDDRPSTRDRRTIMYNDRLEAYKQEDKQHLENLVKKVIPRLSFLNKNNCLGVIDGDHYRVYSNGVTSNEVICKALGIPYLGDGQAIIRLVFTLYKSCIKTFNIHVRHGRGFNITTGAKINANKRFVDAWEGIDLFVKGHSHSSWDDDVVRNVVSPKGFIYTKTITTINSTSFKKTFIMQEEKNIIKNKILHEIKDEEERIRELEKLIGIKKNDVDYAEKREYPPVNKRIIYYKIRLSKNRNNPKKISDVEMIGDIGKLML